MPTYISAEGLQKLKDEMQHRKTVERREIAEKISQAKELGDLSENFEYHDAKEQQGMNEVRILNIGTMIQDAVIVEPSSGGDNITLGVTFIVEIDGSERTYSMVGSTEADPLEGKISNESPIGFAFFGKKIGDTVNVETPGGLKSYKIKDIK